MVDILERGTPPKDTQYTTSCNNCHSKLRFKRSEARENHDQRDGDALIIKCPVCDKEIWKTL